MTSFVAPLDLRLISNLVFNQAFHLVAVIFMSFLKLDAALTFLPVLSFSLSFSSLDFCLEEGKNLVFFC